MIWYWPRDPPDPAGVLRLRGRDCGRWAHPALPAKSAVVRRPVSFSPWRQVLGMSGLGGGLVAFGPLCRSCRWRERKSGGSLGRKRPASSGILLQNGNPGYDAVFAFERNGTRKFPVGRVAAPLGHGVSWDQGNGRENSFAVGGPVLVHSGGSVVVGYRYRERSGRTIAERMSFGSRRHWHGFDDGPRVATGCICL